MAKASSLMTRSSSWLCWFTCSSSQMLRPLTIVWVRGFFSIWFGLLHHSPCQINDLYLHWLSSSHYQNEYFVLSSLFQWSPQLFSCSLTRILSNSVWSLRGKRYRVIFLIRMLDQKDHSCSRTCWCNTENKPSFRETGLLSPLSKYKL